MYGNVSHALNFELKYKHNWLICYTHFYKPFLKQILQMEQKKYDLDFNQALEIVLNGGAVKGQNFVDGVFLKLNSYGQLITVDACRLYAENERVFIKGFSQQKFRNLTVMTVKELCG